MRRFWGLAWPLLLAGDLTGCGAGQVTCQDVLNPSPEKAVAVAQRINAALAARGIDPQDTTDARATALLSRLTSFCAERGNLARDIDEAFP
ncbi:hypothetical protein [Buchananella hordeovulneris]|uniref:hypothetical protein n=1 Tax=Buchananella hordeovulneris TaxID=52770 RepID=UPI000F5D9341|nr:hypothetical protein [Buchananella hordeovulneris]RRD45547.1 hypothetical protein EII13_01420 [Buchananella hordeovulneris]